MRRRAPQMGEAKFGEEVTGERETRDPESANDPNREQDPGAYIGSDPEREAETIPGGVRPGDERVAAHDARPGVAGEPDDNEITDGPEEDFPPAPGD